MATVTIGRWGLRVPDGTELPNVPLWMNRLATDLSDVAKDNQGTLGARPTSTAVSPSNKPGGYYRDSDRGYLTRDTGSGWLLVAPMNAAGVHASRPTATAELEGLRWTSTDKGVTYVCTGAAWVFVSAEPVVSASRPASPVDRQLWEYDASGIAGVSGNTVKAAGVRWVFRYDAASTYWIHVHGAELASSYVATAQNPTGFTTPAPWGDCATVGPSLVVPAWTGVSDWHVTGSAYLVGAVNQVRYNIGVAVGATAPTSDAAWGSQSNIVTGEGETVTGPGRVDGVAAGGELRLRYSSTNGVPQVSDRKLLARPIRVAG